MRAVLSLAVLLSAGLPLCVRAAESDGSRFALRAPATLEPAPERAGPYAIKARFAAEASAGELRERAQFRLIGRIAAKGSVACGTPEIFADGFEMP